MRQTAALGRGVVVAETVEQAVEAARGYAPADNKFRRHGARSSKSFWMVRFSAAFVNGDSLHPADSSEDLSGPMMGTRA